MEHNQFKSKYSIVITSDNFDCGLSREHSSVALGVMEVATVVAESYVRIFFRNSVASDQGTSVTDALRKVAITVDLQSQYRA
ncbi:3-isopropylmalate dehydratase small subunit 1 [Camellia lanceoleosa]|uniref:3-isopropylmalate dehydratase small subunit 1 n=1 Tax=Camellia lanceoleosa TaxID=1840588 RepID=A0ACC0IXS2_9ERIC|nr:3-isopropylmalate dehydratase small subunit 1 [Camellia lanceoleosa]